jgi:hypothetical protein
MSHGLISTHIGTCDACRRENVALHQHARFGEVTGYSCVDQFACFAEWQRLRYPETRENAPQSED